MPDRLQAPRLVPILDRRRSRRFSVIEIQKPTQPLATNDSSRPSRILVTTVDQVIVESLMVPFLMIVLRVLEDRTPQMGLAQGNQTVD
jgi:hypothetical protein